MGLEIARLERRGSTIVGLMQLLANDRASTRRKSGNVPFYALKRKNRVVTSPSRAGRAKEFEPGKGQESIKVTISRELASIRVTPATPRCDPISRLARLDLIPPQPLEISPQRGCLPALCLGCETLRNITSPLNGYVYFHFVKHTQR